MNVVDMKLRDPALEEVDTRTVLAQAARQARLRKYDDFLIVDIDAHHYENESFSEIIPFIEDPVIRKTAQAKAGMGPGRPSMMVPQAGFQDVSGRITRYTTRRLEKTPPTPHRDITLTTRWMDALGVDIACLFPTPLLGLALHPQAAIEAALSRAYNRWLVEKILPQAPTRLRSMLYLPFNDPDACYEMVRDFGDKPGVIGFMVTSTQYRPVYDNALMKTYALLQEMGKPLAFHAHYHWSAHGGMGPINQFIGIHALGFTVSSMVHLTNWVTNGLCERFPKLKMIWIESGVAWIPFLMQRLDNEYMMRSSECPALKRLPSEYMREMYYSSQPIEMVNNLPMLEATFKMIGAQTQLLYSSDYPHWDMDLPSTIYDLPFLSEQDKRNILGGNARRIFDLPDTLSEPKLARRAS